MPIGTPETDLKTIRPAAALACFGLACCVPPAPEPTPAPPQRQTVDVPVVTQANPPARVVPPPTNWIDAPQTPGDWRYARVDGGSLARFGAGADPVFGLGCMASSRRVVLLRYGMSSAVDVPMVIRTETTDRALSAKPANDGQGVSAALPAGDPLLDAMAFSRGRFAVETQGAAPLYLPSWPEVSRVIEDCR